MSRFSFPKRPIILAISLAIMLGGCLLMRAAGMWGPAVADAPPSQDSPNKAQGSVNEAGVPTADFIAAALRNQASASIEVKYASSTGRFRYHYIRTPEALSLTRTNSDDGDVKQASYDFAARETKVLNTKENGTRSGNVLTPWLGAPFAARDMLDPVLFMLPWGTEGPRPLYESVRSGQVCPQQEDVDGHSCWRVDFTWPQLRYSIWVDPDVGYYPRRIEMVPTGDESPMAIRVTSYQDYTELAAGIWFPMKQVHEFPVAPTSEGTRAMAGYPDSFNEADIVPRTERKTVTRIASEATAGKTFSKDALLVKFPSGMKVSVNSSSELVTIP